MSVLDWFVPWEFSPTAIIVIAVAGLLYLRGSLRRNPGLWRQVSFWTGLALIYVMLLTHFDYYSEREFFMHRLQHLGLHHMGPFLIILSAPGATLRSAMPVKFRAEVWNRFVHSPPVHFVLEVLLNPWVASCMFFGIIYFWLWPPIHFIAMLDWRWYRVMNWSVTVDGLFFWWLILDHRPRPPARIAPGWRIMVPLFVALPQILAGTFIVFHHGNLYPIYDLCGRAFATVTSMDSQRYGGLILWIPGSMMSALAAMLALRHWIRLSASKRLVPKHIQRAARLRAAALAAQVTSAPSADE